MSRIQTIRSPRHATPWAAGSFAACAALIGATLLAAAPARAEHVEGAVASHLGRVAASHFLLAGDLFFGHAPVVEVHYRESRYGHGHRHHAKCGHEHWRGHGFKHGNKHWRGHGFKHGNKHWRGHGFKHGNKHGHRGRGHDARGQRHARHDFRGRH